MLPILLLGVILSEAKNLEDIRMGKEFSKNIRFISTSGSRPHPLRARRQAHSRRHHARRSPPVGTPRILCPLRYGQGSCHRLAKVRHRVSEEARLDDVRHAFSDYRRHTAEVMISRFNGYDEGMRIASLFSCGYSIVLLILHSPFVILNGVKDLENIKDGEKELFIL